MLLLLFLFLGCELLYVVVQPVEPLFPEAAVALGEIGHLLERSCL
jgi:hypothetical protein